MLYLRMMTLILLAPTALCASEATTTTYEAVLNPQLVEGACMAQSTFKVAASPNITLGALRDLFVQAFLGRFDKEKTIHVLPENSGVFMAFEIESKREKVTEEQLATQVSALGKNYQKCLCPNVQEVCRPCCTITLIIP